jgi:hypothetical protein
LTSKEEGTDMNCLRYSKATERAGCIGFVALNPTIFFEILNALTEVILNSTASGSQEWFAIE